ncbi:response regulator [Salipaludibacillus agaradhaerens]|uniref:response regulator n=1 Tax=Salipaludibacillus agaradhaerens TaxID=76935 RepID=UPI0021509BD6|nr:response regulator [Salipaludibacillus agaradhaerens]MCR6108332.1 response regulator [Salipaludibacillus agaradhaerens]MCR6120357.1 response regulator [Salipaludibacillus agaradhaerens]
MSKILVADDSDILRMLIVDTLEEEGEWVVEEAEDGREALNKLETGGYDLALLDYMMPEMTGIDVCEKVSPAVKEQTKLVMLTAKAQEKDRQEAREAGIVYFIPKPFSPEELIRIIKELLS